ncbi:MAG: hypothetical protein KAJ10_11480 [Thermodesulfovibrionia bacterium]|nr:hypothetical protein [Thermodesulfovibrionia bacterium]
MAPFAYPDNPIVWIVVAFALSWLVIPRIRGFVKANKEDRMLKIKSFLLGIATAIIMIVVLGVCTMLLSL